MLINCPECNQTVSDKAEFCPHCGIRINGVPAPKANSTSDKKGGGNKGLVVSFIIALLIMSIGYYFYNDAQEKKEMDAYEYALQSGDEMVMQNYLSKFMNAPREHRDSINARLNMLKEEAGEWENAVNSGTRGALLAYIEQNPSSPHVAEAKNKIDSIDYAKAEREYKNANGDSGGTEALKKYIKEHPDGRYATKVQEILDEAKAKELTPEDFAMAREVCKKFFQAINSKNESKLLLTVSDYLSSFLNHNNAPSSDVVDFMNRLYKSDITNMNWHILDNFKAEKVLNGINGATDASGKKYTIKVLFGAEQHIERTDPSKETLGKYIVSAEITPEGKIDKFNMKKVKQGE